MNPVEVLQKPAFAPYLLRDGQWQIYRDPPLANRVHMHCVVSVLPGASNVQDSGAVEASKILVYTLFDPTQMPRAPHGINVDWGPITDCWNEIKRRDYDGSLLHLREIDSDLYGEPLMSNPAVLEAVIEPLVNEATKTLIAQIRVRLLLWR